MSARRATVQGLYLFKDLQRWPTSGHPKLPFTTSSRFRWWTRTGGPGGGEKRKAGAFDAPAFNANLGGRAESESGALAEVQ